MDDDFIAVDKQKVFYVNQPCCTVDRVFDVNRHLVLAVTAIGGHATCETQAAYLNLPSPVTTYTNHQEAATTADKEIALISMTKAATEAKQHQASSNISVSVDGTWQRHGFSTKNGNIAN